MTRLAKTATAAVIVAVAAGSAGCGGESPPDIPGGGEEIPESNQGGKVPAGAAAEAYEGEAKGISFQYQGGNLTVNTSKAPQSVADAILGQKVTAACGDAQAEREWPGGAKSLGFTLQIEPVEEDPTAVTVKSCELRVLGQQAPIVTAPMKQVSKNLEPAGAPSRGP